MIAHLKYLRYIIRHKWFVFVACYRMGIPLRGLMHDLSKFLPSEWFPYANYFYADGTQAPFNRAWLNHQHRNKHHWQYWILREDSGASKLIPMPESVVREMVADWIGAGLAITGRLEVGEWYIKNQGKIHLHSETAKKVRELITWYTWEYGK